MTTVTTGAIKKLMLDNLILFIENNLTDPSSTDRTAAETFVTLQFSTVSPRLPQAYIGIERAVGTQTGVANNMETHQFGIYIHHDDQIQLITLTDELYNDFKKDYNVVSGSKFFFNAKMFRPEDYIQPWEMNAHESAIGEFFSKFVVKFDFFHTDA